MAEGSTAQIAVRLVLLLLISLGGLAIAFDLDVVLGAFAAGFVLRRALPDGDESLEHKLEGLAFGLLIPIFFITSGMTIDPAAIAANPLDLLIFVLAILVIRGGRSICRVAQSATLIPGNASSVACKALRLRCTARQACRSSSRSQPLL